MNKDPLMYTQFEVLLTGHPATLTTRGGIESSLRFRIQRIPIGNMKDVAVSAIIAIGARVIKNDFRRWQADAKTHAPDLGNKLIPQSRRFCGYRIHWLSAYCTSFYENTKEEEKHELLHKERF